MPSLMWPPITIAHHGKQLTLRIATPSDVSVLEQWDRDPDVIACVTDNPGSEQAFAGANWIEEIESNSPVSCYYIAEVDGQPIGAMQVIDPYLEPTHYWGEIEPNLRAVDIWIGAAADRNCGYGARMMATMIERCFADPAVIAIVIDPLNSNTEAHRFYRRLGFKVAGRRIFGGEDDCLVHRLSRADCRGV